MLAACHQLAVACAQPDVGLPTAVLDHFGLLFEPQLQVSTDLGWVPIRPGTFDQRPSGMSITGFGNRTLLAPVTGGVFCRDQAQKLHEFSGGIEPAEVANGFVFHLGHRDQRRDLGQDTLRQLSLCGHPCQ
jgi:hypothetical protein